MERMTKIYPSGGWGITGELDDAILRLAAYEETGLEPEDIKQACTEEAILKLAGQSLGITPDRLRELAEADREGRCVVLPCKVGDTVYQVDDIRVYALEVRNLIYDAGILAFDESTIGKTVFLTRAEAEAALRREQDDHETA